MWWVMDSSDPHLIHSLTKTHLLQCTAVKHMQFGFNITLLQTDVETFDVVSCSADSVQTVSPQELRNRSPVPALSCTQR